MGARLACVIAASVLAAGCRGATPPIKSAPLPTLVLNAALPDDAQICVPRAVFVNEGLACITVGELREQLRGRRDIACVVRP